jgi:hypothetical protein
MNLVLQGGHAGGLDWRGQVLETFTNSQGEASQGGVSLMGIHLRCNYVDAQKQPSFTLIWFGAVSGPRAGGHLERLSWLAGLDNPGRRVLYSL